MRMNLAVWGNKLHSGEKTYPVVAQRKRWFAASALLMALCLGLLLFKGLTPGIDFTGGTAYRVSAPAEVNIGIAEDVFSTLAPESTPTVVVAGETDISVRLGELPEERVIEGRTALAEAYGVTEENVSFSQIGPTWGAEIGAKAIQALVIFLLLVAAVLSVYFRAWRMAAAALAALAHDLIFTIGIYALVGFEVTPAAVIGFLTILGYSLYDTVVVFDKVKENTENLTTQFRYTYAELANLAINQTLVRSINTSVVALLPVTAILFIGSMLLGAGTLTDIALALFLGMLVGTYSSVFVATPLEVAFRGNETRIKEHTAKVLALRESGESDVVLTDDGQVRVGALAPGGHRGTRAQPKRKGRK
ncbi:MAG: protein translocase subunit SecF [Actinobacteria bacterium HGW-Actinobacteria-4]|nr:MAG: protein translocase subunit SecF [Actinobacteria bacterium HGW-Actinobacteria-4]